MAIHDGSTGKKGVLYRGDHKPAELYLGNKKIVGWQETTQSGTSLTFEDTYNDKVLSAKVKGDTVQKSEWVHKEGLTTQDSFAVNDEITVPYRGHNLIFRIVHIYGELLTLEMKYVFG